ncbi:hypothetical protein GQF03_03580 [Sneathiella chungangensis]|uniref:Beta-lactamase n=1 Tax=Sneathiella chungangensis TaxID=1418234 RepID=A0A845MED6_9PROT|nr:tetratricopeptide repeat protein [Sneathiella chungangensis]MZR21404.1 hypothetical protein [Sneathiella chungangensis]
MQALRDYSIFLFYFLTAMMCTVAAASEITSSSSVSDQEAACKKEDLQSCYFLAERYLLGLGVSHNKEMAISLLNKACDRGHGKSCLKLGGWYVATITFGDSKNKTPEDSVIIGLFDKSCELGEMEGCAYMGTFYVEGAGVDKDISKSISYFQKACDGGYAEVCSGLGMMLIKGSTVPGDEKRGSAVPVDKKRGQASLQKGCDLGDKKACKYLDEK